MNRWDGIYQVLPTRGDCPRKKLSSGNCSRHAPSPNRFLEEQGRIKNQTLNLSVCHSVRARRVDSGYFMAAGYLIPLARRELPAVRHTVGKRVREGGVEGDARDHPTYGDLREVPGTEYAPNEPSRRSTSDTQIRDSTPSPAWCQPEEPGAPTVAREVRGPAR